MPSLLELALFLKCRRPFGVVAILVASAVVAGVWGTLDVALPSVSGDGSISMPLWVLIPIPAGAAIATGLASDMSDFEIAAPRTSRMILTCYLACALLMAAGLQATGLFLGAAESAAAPAIRNLVFWTGLALVSGRLLGRRLAWVFPLAALFPFDWFGFDAVTNQPKWWALPILPSNSASWLAAAATMLAGTALALLSQQRTARLKRGLKRLVLPRARQPASSGAVTRPPTGAEVPGAGVEPARLSAAAFKAAVSAVPPPGRVTPTRSTRGAVPR